MSKIYKVFGLKMSAIQLEEVLKSAEKGTSVTIRLKKNQLHGDQMMSLTQTQINKSTKGLDLPRQLFCQKKALMLRTRN